MIERIDVLFMLEFSAARIEESEGSFPTRNKKRQTYNNFSFIRNRNSAIIEVIPSPIIDVLSIRRICPKFIHKINHILVKVKVLKVALILYLFDC